MKNPIRNLRSCYQQWRSFADEPGVFSLTDACRQIDRVIAPARFHYSYFKRKLRKEVSIQPEPDGAVQFHHHESGLVFYLPKDPGPNAWGFIEQEFCPANPHHYLTDPIHLSPESTVLDVGACEGLFAYRLLVTRLAKQVICFEPSSEMCALITRGARANHVSDRITVECQAVSRVPGRVVLQSGTTPEANSVVQAAPDDEHSIPATSIDAYCRQHGIHLRPIDLLKIDAEGADLDVLVGAEEEIRAGSPQIAVTTYHTDEHPKEILGWLKKTNPAYRYRLKGFSNWTTNPRPVLLQASTLPSP